MTTFTTEDRLHAGEYPLTDEQIQNIYLEKYDGHMGFLSPDEVKEFARAIERAHGIGELP